METIGSGEVSSKYVEMDSAVVLPLCIVRQSLGERVAPFDVIHNSLQVESNVTLQQQKECHYRPAHGPNGHVQTCSDTNP
jgi:hypothetical protein